MEMIGCLPDIFAALRALGYNPEENISIKVGNPTTNVLIVCVKEKHIGDWDPVAKKFKED